MLKQGEVVELQVMKGIYGYYLMGDNMRLVGPVSKRQLIRKFGEVVGPEDEAHDVEGSEGSRGKVSKSRAEAGVRVGDEGGLEEDRGAGAGREGSAGSVPKDEWNGTGFLTDFLNRGQRVTEPGDDGLGDS